MPRVFEGIKVLDFTWAAVGPITTRYLADFGATVVRVESRSHPCVLRTTPPYAEGRPGVDRAGYFSLYSPNKYSVTINMNHPKGPEIIKRFILWADVVAESFRAEMMEEWGLGYEEVRKIKPDIIMYRTSMQGHTGPHARLRGSGVNLTGLAGFSSLCGWPEREPTNPYGAYTDTIAPRFGAAMLIAALDYRRRTGQGQLLDMSQLEAALQFIAPAIMDYFVNNRVAERGGNSCSYAAPHGAYRCRGKDRWCAVAVFTDEQWQSFCRVIGEPAWTADPRFATFLGRKDNEKELDRLVEEWTSGYDPQEVMTRMQEAGVPAGIVQTGQDLFQDPQLKHYDHFWTLNHKGIGPFSHMGQACHLSKTPAEARMPSPLLGEHTEYICKQMLGMSDEEFVQLLVEGVLG